MMKITKIIISPYFSHNTNLVANFCKCCYLNANSISITSINVTFLKNYDAKQYRSFKYRWTTANYEEFGKQSLKSIKQESQFKGFSQKEIQKSVFNINNFYYQNIMSLRFTRILLMQIKKRRIMRKYTKFYRKYVYRRKNNNNQQLLHDEKKQVYFEKGNFSHIESDDKIEKLRFICNSDRTNIKSELEIKHETHEVLPEQNYHNQAHQTNIIKTEQLEMKNRNIKIELDEEKTRSRKLKWIPPLSPHNLIEERFYHDPWALIVVTIFLNKTSCSLALPYINKFFADFKGPYDVLKIEIAKLEPYFYKIGLVRTRATQVWRMSYDFVHKDWKSAKELYGVGKYAEDAYRMFHLGDFSVQPTDRYLKIYKAWYEMMKNQEEFGTFGANCQVYLEDYYVPPEDEDRRGGNLTIM